MTLEGPRGGELAELVPDHVLGDEHGDVRPAVVDRDRVTDHRRDDRRGARPGLDDPLLTRRVHLLDLRHQVLRDERTFFE